MLRRSFLKFVAVVMLHPVLDWQIPDVQAPDGLVRIVLNIPCHWIILTGNLDLLGGLAKPDFSCIYHESKETNEKTMQ